MSLTASVQPSDPIKDLVVVAAAPHRARLLERLHLDYFCLGDWTLEEACFGRGLDIGTVATVIDPLDRDATAARHEVHDVGGATTWDLCTHLVTAHHAPLPAELRRIAELAEVARPSRRTSGLVPV
jgi:iron-sulfur cluster repair protein YtfE (RIC family)